MTLHSSVIVILKKLKSASWKLNIIFSILLSSFLTVISKLWGLNISSLLYTTFELVFMENESIFLVGVISDLIFIKIFEFYPYM